MNKFGNTLLILISAIAVVALISTGYFFWQTTQLRQTPTTEKPIDINDSTTSPVTPIKDQTANWKTYANAKYNFSLKYPENYSALEVSADYVRFFQGTNDPNLPSPQTYLSIQLEQNPNSTPDPNLTYKTSPNGQTFRITRVMMGTEDNQKPEVQQVFNQIVSTFKFTGSLAATGPSNWKSYHNEETGLTVLVPQRFTFTPDKFAVDDSIDFTGTSKPDSISIHHEKFSGNLESFLQHIKNPSPGGYPMYSLNYDQPISITISGFPAIKFSGNYGDSGVVFVHSGIGYIFYSGVTNQDEINQMISSIKFD